MFASLPDKPDHPAIEEAILELWDREGTFTELRARNADGPRFSFIDGPVTANKILAVHTAWGRTLKDVFQRYKAMHGYHQRYQNGFDCQGLWIEVGVEKDLGLNSKRDIEEYGLEAFAEKCRAVVEWSAAELTKSSIRLGQWMDWENSYYTFSDTNIEYIWRFLKIVDERGWLFKGHRSTEWCPRCGTSISAHELAGSYVDRQDPALSVRLRLRDRLGESLVIWTTTPWTLPANVAAAVHPELDYGLRGGDWAVVTEGADRDAFDVVLAGSEMVGWRYEGPFDELGPGSTVTHAVIPWTEVAADEGTGIVHIAPGCGTEDFLLSQELGLDVLTPVDEAGAFYSDYGWLAGRGAHESADDIAADLDKRGLLVRAETIEHRYAECWRCHTPLIFRLSDDWFISVEEIREPMRAANGRVSWTPEYVGKRMDDWLVNMADWNISRRRYYGLPLPFYPCACGHVTVIGSRAELADRATTPLEGLEQLRRPWIDRVKIACASCGEEVERISEVGDVWLDAGIVPFSTLGWKNETALEQGYATGAAAGLTTADLPDHQYWEEWFPADWVSEMREQVRLWFYSQLFMSVALTGEAPFRKVLSYEKMLDDQGREMHGSWGNMLSAEEAFSQMGADVMRWQYCAQPPNQNLLFGLERGRVVQRKLLTLWNSVLLLVQYANLTDFAPHAADLESPPQPNDVLDRWAVTRTGQLLREATAAFEEYQSAEALRAFDSFVDDLSNWYIRRSRRRFWNGDLDALGTLWYCLVQGVRVISPVMPFLADHLWRVLVSDIDAKAPRSVFLAGWPAPPETIDDTLLADMAAARRVVELGRQARAANGLRVRQPLRRLVIEGAEVVGAYADIVADELRVKGVTSGSVAGGLRVRPNLRVLGPRLGEALPAVRAALEAGQWEQLDGGSFRVGEHVLGPDDVLVDRTEAEGWAVLGSEEGGLTVALDVNLDDDLRREARVYDLVHRVNTERKEAGLAITDRITLVLAASDADLLEHRDWIMTDTLAVDVSVAPEGNDLSFTRAG